MNLRFSLCICHDVNEKVYLFSGAGLTTEVDRWDELGIIVGWEEFEMLSYDEEKFVIRLQGTDYEREEEGYVRRQIIIGLAN